MCEDRTQAIGISRGFMRWLLSHMMCATLWGQMRWKPNKCVGCKALGGSHISLIFIITDIKAIGISYQIYQPHMLIEERYSINKLMNVLIHISASLVIDFGSRQLVVCKLSRGLVSALDSVTSGPRTPTFFPPLTNHTMPRLACRNDTRLSTKL